MTRLGRVGGWPAVVTALGAAVLALGPALGPGLVQSYDLVWSPDARLTPVALGLDTPAPRAVPSDAVAVLLGKILTPPVAEKAVLLGMLALAGLGCAALLCHLVPVAGRVACAASAAFALWNPFVAERLVIGQWTVLMGYAVIPWAVRAAFRVREHSGRLMSIAAWLVLAGVGGANSLAVVLMAVIAVLLWPPAEWRGVLLCGATALGVGAAWWLPSLARGARTSAEAFAVFGARPDTPLGLVGSLVSGGGMWNRASHPPERAHLAVALLALLLSILGLAAAIRLRRARPLLAAAAIGLLVAAVSGWSVVEAAWSAVAHLPGGGLLRDAQKFLAPLVIVTAVGLGTLGHMLSRRGTALQAAAVALVVLPVLALPSLAWGANGRLEARSVPSDLRAGAARLSEAPEGTVGLLPWGQYRRYEWNDGHISLSLVPRMVEQRVLYDDSLPLSSGRVPGEDARAAAVSAAIGRGTDPYAALAAAGVRYVAVEHGAGIATPAMPAAYGTVIHDSAHLVVIERTGSAGPGHLSYDPALVAGWALSLATAGAVIVMAATGRPRGLYSR